MQRSVADGTQEALAAKEKILKNEEFASSRVAVQVWVSKDNPHKQGLGVGHVSIQTSNAYISLSPENDPKDPKESKGLGIMKGVPHQFVASYEIDQDRKHEERPADFIFCFYTLNARAIEREYERCQKEITGWSLHGKISKTESCISLAWHLLEFGGIQRWANKATHAEVSSSGAAEGSSLSGKNAVKASSHLASSDYAASSNDSNKSKGASVYSLEMLISSIVKSPDYLVQLLKKAKENELKISHETRIIPIQKNEWKPTESVTANRYSFCCAAKYLIPLAAVVTGAAWKYYAPSALGK